MASSRTNNARAIHIVIDDKDGQKTQRNRPDLRPEASRECRHKPPLQACRCSASISFVALALAFFTSIGNCHFVLDYPTGAVFGQSNSSVVFAPSADHTARARNMLGLRPPPLLQLQRKPKIVRLPRYETALNSGIGPSRNCATGNPERRD